MSALEDLEFNKRLSKTLSSVTFDVLDRSSIEPIVELLRLDDQEIKSNICIALTGLLIATVNAEILIELEVPEDMKKIVTSPDYNDDLKYNALKFISGISLLPEAKELFIEISNDLIELSKDKNKDHELSRNSAFTIIANLTSDDECRKTLAETEILSLAITALKDLLPSVRHVHTDDEEYNPDILETGNYHDIAHGSLAIITNLISEEETRKKLFELEPDFFGILFPYIAPPPFYEIRISALGTIRNILADKDGQERFLKADGLKYLEPYFEEYEDMYGLPISQSLKNLSTRKENLETLKKYDIIPKLTKMVETEFAEHYEIVEPTVAAFANLALTSDSDIEEAIVESNVIPLLYNSFNDTFHDNTKNEIARFYAILANKEEDKFSEIVFSNDVLEAFIPRATYDNEDSYNCLLTIANLSQNGKFVEKYVEHWEQPMEGIRGVLNYLLVDPNPDFKEIGTFIITNLLKSKDESLIELLKESSEVIEKVEALSKDEDSNEKTKKYSAEILEALS